MFINQVITNQGQNKVSLGVSEMNEEEINVHQSSIQHCDHQSRTENEPLGVSEMAEEIKVHQSSIQECDCQSRTENEPLGVSEMAEEIKAHHSSIQHCDHQSRTENEPLGESEMTEEIKVQLSSIQHSDHQSRTENEPLGVSEMAEEIKVHQSRIENDPLGESEVSKKEIMYSYLNLNDTFENLPIKLQTSSDHQSKTEQVSLGVSEVSKEEIKVQSSDHCEHQSRTKKALLGVKKISKKGYSYLKLNDTFKKLPIKVHHSSDHQTRTEQVSLVVSEMSKEIRVHQSSDQHCDHQLRTEQVLSGVSEGSKGETCNLFVKENIVYDSGQNSSESAAERQNHLSEGEKKNLWRKNKKMKQQHDIPYAPTTDKEEGDEKERKEYNLPTFLPAYQPQTKRPRDDSQKTSESAAGVRYPLTKTQKRNLRRMKEKMRKQQSITLVPTTERKERDEKRREESDEPQAKRPTQNFKFSKIAIVKEGFPLNKLNNDEYNLIQMEILRRIDVTPSNDILPRILRANLSFGAVIFFCNDNTTVSWLIEQFDYNGGVVKESILKVLSTDSLPKLVKVAFITKDTFTREPAVILHRLQRFNPSLKCENWRVLQQKLIDAQTYRWIFQVQQESAEAIKQQELKAFTGLHQGFFQILDDPSTKEQENALV